ncbi:hypothetical protein KEM48_007479 [Puccinia striiformis f. sp. tritici PST-130]|nr:hypothetical protein KEM48_007479 [Puccinia striiformis f. sp. tritici PST-130]
MKYGDHASNYISSFRALQSRLPGWGDRPLMFHFRKGLPTRVLDLLAQNTEVFNTLSELIEATLKIDTRHHERQKEKKRENGSQPLQPKKDTSKTASAPPPQLREIRQLRSQLRKPLLKSPRTYAMALEENLVDFQNLFFPPFTWECLVIDATGNDDAILGYDFLTHWNPDINWSEGLIIPRALLPAAPIKLPSSSPQEPVSLRSLIAMSSNGSLPDDLHPPGNSSTFIPSVVYLASQDKSYDFETEEVLIRSITTGSRQEVFEGDFFDDPPADLETILPTIPSEYHEFASLFSTILSDQLPPRRACDHRIDLLGPVPKKGTIYRLSEPKDKDCNTLTLLIGRAVLLNQKAMRLAERPAHIRSM